MCARQVLVQNAPHTDVLIWISGGCNQMSVHSFGYEMGEVKRNCSRFALTWLATAQSNGKPG